LHITSAEVRKFQSSKNKRIKIQNELTSLSHAYIFIS
jgi:hypothetical protein